MKIKIKSVKNIRDFSEYGCPDFIRSAQLSGLSSEDAMILAEKYGLKTIIDLRTTQEVSEKPDAEIAGVEYLHIPVFDDAIPGISHEEKSDDLLPEIPDMAKMYYAIATGDEYVTQLKKALDVIFDKERKGGVLWHCTEGKDRCGMVSAMFLLANGVSKEEVLKDYLKTNRTNFTKAWKYYFLILLAKKGKVIASKVRDAFLAKREYLEPVMDILFDISSSYRK